jgi:hypothetical protein
MRDDVIAVFADPDAASRALATLRSEGVTTARVASPAPYPAVHQTGHPGPWRVLGWIALVAGIAGLGGAIALEVGASTAMGHIVGGKPVVSWTAFGVVMFEMTMLLAGVSTLLATVILAAIARRRVARRARQAVTSDRIVVVIPAADAPDQQREALAKMLADAVEVLS